MKKKLLIVIIIGCSIQTIWAQNEISGVVADENGHGIPGATIMEKGTSNGAISDFDGNYSISVGDEAKLEFSYLGYVPQIIPVGTSATINVALIPDLQKLDEVIVIGYGTQKESDITGSVGSVDGKELGKYTAADATESLQGRVAGVNVEQNGGAPGADPIVTIRGSGTLSDSGPLYVIDGMLTGSMSSLNPADIESVNVLKDASAAAIYGSRAANGVIIVTTKKGSYNGKLAMNLDYTSGISSPVKLLDFASARQYADIRNMSNDNGGLPRALANDSEFNPNIDSDIQKASTRAAPNYNVNFRISGGSENLKFNASANHLSEGGIVVASSFKRSTLRLNSVFRKGKFKLEENLGFTNSVNQPNPYFNRERDHIPTAPLYNPNFDGGFAASADPKGGLGFHGVQDAINSLGLAELEERKNTSNSLLGNVMATYEIIEGLNYKLNLGLEYRSSNNFQYTPTYFFAQSNSGQNLFNTLKEQNGNSYSTLIENTLSYDKLFGRHNLGLLIGYTEQQDKSRFLGIVASNFPSNEIRVASAAATLQEAPSSETVVGLRSYFGRVNYGYDNRYLLTATLRSDGSSQFAKDKRWGTFPSIALGWNIANESFMSRQSFFDKLKVRASYGQLGSNNIGPYETNPVLNTSSDYILGSGGGTRLTGFAQTIGVNPDLQWAVSYTHLTLPTIYSV